jgi:hypothetical protein
VKDYLPSSPHLFRIIKIAMMLLVGMLLVLAMVIPAPLDGPADIAQTPNPAKAAWFFLWIQELASYSKYLIYMTILIGFFFLLLPFIPGISEANQAKWLPKDQRWINIVTVIIFIGILVLTIIAMFLRGENWAFVFLF